MKSQFFKIVNIQFMLLILVFLACESKPKKVPEIKNDVTLNIENATTENSSLVCELLSEEYILKLFPEAIDFQPRSMEKPYPSCSYRFTVNGTNHKVGITLVKKYASEKNLDKSMTYIKSEKELLKGIGKKAYYILNLGQVSVFDGNYLVHIYATVKEAGDKEMAIRITKDILEKL